MDNYKQPDINLLVCHACIASHLFKDFNASPEYPINHKRLLDYSNMPTPRVWNIEYSFDAYMLQSLCGNFVIEGRGRGGGREFLAPHRLSPELLNVEAAQRAAI